MFVHVEIQAIAYIASGLKVVFGEIHERRFLLYVDCCRVFDQLRCSDRAAYERSSALSRAYASPAGRGSPDYVLLVDPCWHYHWTSDSLSTLRRDDGFIAKSRRWDECRIRYH